MELQVGQEEFIFAIYYGAIDFPKLSSFKQQTFSSHIFEGSGIQELLS